MKVICIRKGKTKGLTENKSYEILKSNDYGYFILNDQKILQFYKFNRFKPIVNQ